MRKVIAAVILGAIVISAWLTYSKITQSQREAAYRAAIAPYQRDLAFGMARVDVEKYFHSRGVQYSWQSGENAAHAAAYVVMIGEEPGGLVCKSWKVYIALEFEPSGNIRDGDAMLEPAPSDKLNGIHIQKLGRCL